MKARKVRLKRPSRFQAFRFLVQEDFRFAIVYWLFMASLFAWIGLLALRHLARSEIIEPIPRLVVEKLFRLVLCTFSASGAVLVIAFRGSKFFSFFSVMERLLTRLPLGVAGIILIAAGSYATFMQPAHHLPMKLAYDGMLWVGSFLFFWVFLFYGRKSSAAK